MYNYSLRIPFKNKTLTHSMKPGRRVSLETATKTAQSHLVMRNGTTEGAIYSSIETNPKPRISMQSLSPNSKLLAYKLDSGKLLGPLLGKVSCFYKTGRNPAFLLTKKQHENTNNKIFCSWVKIIQSLQNVYLVLLC